MKIPQNNNFISGIYNYCDRWCERCFMTSKCLVFYEENKRKKTIDQMFETDNENEKFWKEIELSFKSAKDLIQKIMEEMDIDPEELEAISRQRESSSDKHARLKKHPLVQSAIHYIEISNLWLSDFDGKYFNKKHELIIDHKSEEELHRIAEAYAIIRWYHLQIQVKLVRALGSKEDVNIEPPEGFPKDSDGSAKVALIGISRSIGAWEEMRKYFPDNYDQLLMFILHLDHLSNSTQEVFPNAESCIRPGFDTLN